MPYRTPFASVMSRDALEGAWKAIRGKARGRGLDGLDVREFEDDLDRRLTDLAQELATQRYVPEPVREVHIPKGDGRKGTRTLGVVSIRDRIVQQSVRHFLTPRLERLFLDCSYGYRPRKGPHKAVRRVSHHLRHGRCSWAATADIHDFFGSVKHSTLLDRLRGVVGDEQILRLLELWLRMGAVDGKGRWRDIGSGVTQGSVISPLLANFYLHPFDQSMVNRGFTLVRYADDFVLLSIQRSDASEALEKAEEYLRSRLSLHLNPHPHPIVSEEDGFPFLGMLFQGGRRALDPERFGRIQAKVRRTAVGNEAQTMQARLRTLNLAVVGWRRYYGELIDSDDLERLDEVVVRGLSDLMKEAYRRGELRSIREGLEALRPAELIMHRSGTKRRSLIRELVRQARASAKAAKAAKSPPDSTRRPPAVRSVATAVRHRKQRHLRRTGPVRELVVTTPGHFIGKSGKEVVIRHQRRVIFRTPVTRLTAITVADRGVSLSADLITACAKAGVPILFVNRIDRVEAVLSAPQPLKPAVATHQIEARTDPARCLAIARRIASGKIRNQRNLLKYLNKYRARRNPVFRRAVHQYEEEVQGLLTELGQLKIRSEDPNGKGLSSLRNKIFSVEGRAAISYWRVYGLALPTTVQFEGRRRRGADDLVNMLLNYGYAVLSSRVYLAVRKAGLVPEVGFLHQPQPGKPTLVYDLMEEFRAQAVDRTVLTLLNRGRAVGVGEDERLDRRTRGLLISTIHDRLATLIRFRGRELTLGEIIVSQATALARHLEGKRKYRPFIGKW